MRYSQIGFLCVFVLALLFGKSWMVAAQDLTLTPIPQATRVVTQDEVNRISRNLYCPVCPNERLDTCGTLACTRWREDIRLQLQQGMNEDEIVRLFVERYGERASAVPLDPTLRAFSLVTPFLLAAIALIIGAYTIYRWRRNQRALTATKDLKPTSITTPSTDDSYRQLIEEDLNP